jgi:hypothetical protein
MKAPLVKSISTSIVALMLSSTAFAEWSKNYVIEWNEPAMYYGAESGVIDPGSDCPAGSNPEPDWIQVLVDAGYTKQEAKWLRDPSHPFRIPNHGQNQMAFRGEGRANIYMHPETTPDPGFTPVTGKIGEGLDLDGNSKNGFTSPTGETGIDNEFYRTLGCWMTYRGPQRQSASALSKNDEMRNGSWTVVMVVSGKGEDPMNDANVQVGFYNSTDPMVKDANGDIARDYTFSIAPDTKFEAIFAAKTVDGVILSTKPMEEVWMRDPSYTRELQLLKARLKLRMQKDGSLTGLVAGYRPWFPIYQGWVEARGSVIEQLTWVQLPAVYYALKRNADYSPESLFKSGNTHISFALRVDAIPAYVVTPDATEKALTVASYKKIAPPSEGRIPAVYFHQLVVDGIVRRRDGTIPGGPDVVIPPPDSLAVANGLPTLGGSN